MATLPTVLAGQQNTGRIPSLTYTFDQVNNRILRAKIDQIDAIKQFVSKTLQTIRYEDLMYSNFYGSEVESLVGTSPDFARTEFPRLVKEALIFDDRITQVSGFQIEIIANELRASFIVQSIFGAIEEALILNI